MSASGIEAMCSSSARWKWRFGEMVLLCVFLQLISTAGAAATAAAAAGSPADFGFQETASTTVRTADSSSHDPTKCFPARTIEEPKPLGIPIPPLPQGRKPNFIVILTDDQGYDDIGVHNPLYVQTPNLDKLYRQSTQFDNFYVAPRCSLTRASLLTGRSYARTGVMSVSGGYDYIHKGEANAAQVMAAAGYKTAQFGKWHNGYALNYRPADVGFHESWQANFALEDPMITYNGNMEPNKGYLEGVLMDKALEYLANVTKSDQPFFVYYAFNSIHNALDGGGGEHRVFPPKYNYMLNLTRYQGVPVNTVKAYAMLKYMDDSLGRLFDFIDTNDELRSSTYIMINGDNGSELFNDEKAKRWVRMPSNMAGKKSTVNEGGIRNSLAVKGPGIQAGVIDSTLLEVTDILPTLVDLAGVSDGDAKKLAGHLPWDGVSFKNLLLVPAGVPAAGWRGDSLATQQQRERMVFELESYCWHSDAVPLLDAVNREVARPQPLFSYDKGGLADNNKPPVCQGLRCTRRPGRPALGFQDCIAIRHKEYKWIGETNKVYRFVNGSHVEGPCTEVPNAGRLAAGFQAAARHWWASVAAEPYSFSKPTYYLGFGNWSVSNVMADGAFQRTPDSVLLLANGAYGFMSVGDYIAFRAVVLTAGTYSIEVLYTSLLRAEVKLSVGTYAEISSGQAPSITSALPSQSVMKGRVMGQLTLPVSQAETGINKTEIWLQVVKRPNMTGVPVFTALGNIRFTLLPSKPSLATHGSHNKTRLGRGNMRMAGAAAASPEATNPDDSTESNLAPAAATTATAEEAVSEAALAPNPDLAKQYQGFWSSLPHHSGSAAVDWDAVRLANRWPEGQGSLESMWSPYIAEGIEGCSLCQPKV